MVPMGSVRDMYVSTKYRFGYFIRINTSIDSIQNKHKSAFKLVEIVQHNCNIFIESCMLIVSSSKNLSREKCKSHNI